jgi:TniQ protein
MFPFGCRSSLPPRLPRPVPPFPGETTASYLYRLAVANELHPDDLRVHLAGRRGHEPVALDALAAATGRSHGALAWALPELRPGVTPRADPVLPGHVRRTVCWRCAARRGAFPYATVWQPAEACTCPGHRIWLGSAANPRYHGQYDVGGLPEILQAQRRHYRLARRHGRREANDAIAEAAGITALWARRGYYPDRRLPLIRALRGEVPITGKLPSGDAVTAVVTYPETVDLARVLAMPRWRVPATIGYDG